MNSIKSYKRQRIVQSVLILSSILIAGTFGSLNSIAESNTADDKIFMLGMAREVTTLNPFTAISDDEYVILGLIYDYFCYPQEGNESYPLLTESYWYMDGAIAGATGSDFSVLSNSSPSDWPLGSIWEYNLTQNVFWSDGVPFTADDVKWTIDTQIGPNYMIYWAFQPYTRWILHVEKLTEYKVRIFFGDIDKQEPLPASFGDTLGFIIMPKHAFTDKPVTYMAYDWDGFPVIGTGCFMGTSNLEDEFIAHESISLVKNQFYDFIDPSDGLRKGLGPAFGKNIDIERLQITFFSEASTRELTLFSGQIDMTNIAPNTYLTWINNENSPEYLHPISELSDWQYSRQLSINAYPGGSGSNNPMRLDPAVHRASSLATNKSLLVKQTYKDMAVEGIGLISPYAADWWWEPGDELSTFNVTDGNGTVIFSYQKPLRDIMNYDIDTANQILEAAGYVWTGEPRNSVRKAGPLVAERLGSYFGVSPEFVLDQPLEFDLLISQEIQKDKEISDLLISEWMKIGIKLNEKMVMGAIWSDQVYSYKYEIVLTYWSGDYDPNYLLFPPTSFALFGWNEFGTANSTYDSYYMTQATTLGYSERKVWVDECLKWQYLSGSVNTLVYPEVCHAYNDLRWTNWTGYFWWFNVEYTSVDQPTPIGIIETLIIIAAIIAIPISYFIWKWNDKKKRMLREE